MTEPTIEELLRSLPDGVEPDPTFEHTLRGRLTAELRGDAHGPARLGPEQTQEMTFVDLRTEDRGPDTDNAAGPPARRSLDRRMLVAAVVVIVAAVGASIALSDDGGSDDDSGVLTSEPESGVSSTPPDDPDDSADVTTVVLDPDDPATPRSFVGGVFERFAAEGQPDPYRVVATENHVWTMSLDGVLVRRDPSTLAETARLQVAGSSMLAADRSAVWVGDVEDGTVKRIDPETAEIVAVVETDIATDVAGPRAGRVGQESGQISEMSFARLGDLDASDGSVWVSDLDGRLLQIDAATDEVVAALSVDISAALVRAAGRHVLLGKQSGTEEVVVLDVTTGEIVARHEVEYLVGADLTETVAYAYDQSGVVTRIDLTNGDIEESEPLGDVLRTNLEIPYFPHRPAVSPSGLVLLTTRSEALALDPDTLEVVARNPVDGDRGMLTIGPDGTAWLIEHGDDVIHRWASVAAAGG